jgi:hypothetical protein
VQLTEDEINHLTEHLLDNFLKEELSTDNESEESNEALQFCPYCHQTAHNTDWWTQEQLAYVHMFAQNIMNEIINKSFIKEMKKISRSNSFIQVKCKELDYVTPWIAPEDNDMEFFPLPCCDKKMKINHAKLPLGSKVCCYECGFVYKARL